MNERKSATEQQRRKVLVLARMLTSHALKQVIRDFLESCFMPSAKRPSAEELSRGTLATLGTDCVDDDMWENDGDVVDTTRREAVSAMQACTG